MADKDRISVFFSYLGFVGFFPPYLAYFFFARSSYARFHAKQGIYLTLLFLGLGTLMGLLRLLALRLGWPRQMIYAAGGVLFFIYIVCNLLAAIFGLLGRRWSLPLIGLWLREPKSRRA